MILLISLAIVFLIMFASLVATVTWCVMTVKEYKREHETFRGHNKDKRI